jgi:RHS repeat-associated protein
MHYAGARFYMSAIGRWGTTDPILDEQGPGALLQQDPRLLTMSAYNYTFNDPANLLDPDGRKPTMCPPCPGLREGLQQARTMEGGDTPGFPSGAARRGGGALKVATGTGMALSGGSLMTAGIALAAAPEPSTTVAGLAILGGGSLIGLSAPVAGSGAVDMAVGDEPGIPSYTGAGDMVTRGTDYETAGQAFDFGVGLLAPTNRLPKSFDTMGEVLDGASNAGTLIDGYGLYHSLSEEAEGGIQAPNATTRQLEPNNPQQDEKSIHELDGPYRQN